jgi:hypothetical protein
MIGVCTNQRLSPNAGDRTECPDTPGVRADELLLIDRQRQIYTDGAANAALDGAGHLVITARREVDGTITSARLTTRNCFATRYGRVEARIRVPANRGTWPAFWMARTSPMTSTTTRSPGRSPGSRGFSTAENTTDWHRPMCPDLGPFEHAFFLIINLAIGASGRPRRPMTRTYRLG